MDFRFEKGVRRQEEILNRKKIIKEKDRYKNSLNLQFVLLLLYNNSYKTNWNAILNRQLWND